MEEKKKLYEKIIDDVALEISISSLWRNRIFKNDKEPIHISSADRDILPVYIKDAIVKDNLHFIVKIVDECDEKFDEGLTIFEFRSEEYSDVISYSANNPNVV